ncbi:hypothetical protein [Prevotella veroralis]|uniref:DUF8188 domain-containing protein n=1 Tax=Prevotella veroralis F0319 TaxID=649761 RepID=C9MQ99_9BACT|nr:hypothetical protein [Prevotella veroralis]EEX18303.1 hypothetical protein HMPREF0973_01799 [Prevotella veroralis F0319]QUB41272.1 hypothetical protein J5A55_03220 [Prevotella veroralis]
MSNFYSRIPAIGATLGTVFALTVATPLVVSLIAKFTLGGNKAAVPYADTYIRTSDTIVVQIPYFTQITPIDKVFTSRAWFAGMAHSEKSTYEQICFYSPEYKRHLAVISFIGGYNVAQMGTGEDAYNVDVEEERFTIICESKTISAYINKTQWQDPTYGTKDNPMPIFFKKSLTGMESCASETDLLTIKPSVYKKFVELYLAHGLEPEEFDRLYGADMKRLGLTD